MKKYKDINEYMKDMESIKDVKYLVDNIGQFNDWKGFADLYFTKKQIRQIKKITGIECKGISIKELYDSLKTI